MKRTPPNSTPASSASSSSKRLFHLTSPDLQSENRETKRIMAGDSVSVGNMSQSDLVKILGCLLDKKTEHLSTKEDIAKLQDEVTALRRECDDLKHEVKTLHEINTNLQQKLEACEEHQKRSNIIFKGLPENSNNPYAEIQEFCENTLSIDKKLTLKNAYRFGKKGGKYPRPILAEFLLQEDSRIVMDRKSKLKGTNFIIHRDHCESFREKRSFILDLKSELQKKNANLDCQVKGKQLILNNKFFSCSDDFSLITRDGDALRELSKAIGSDVRETVLALAKSAKGKLPNDYQRGKRK